MRRWSLRGRKADVMPVDLESLLDTMVAADASDLYLKVGQVPYLRVQGSLVPLKHAPMSADAMDTNLALVLTEPQRNHFAAQPDLDVAYLAASGARYRINCFRQRGHVGMVVRWVRSSDLALDHLRLPPVLAEWAGCKQGLVIVTGPTGSGKSTTLSAMVELMNHGEPRHIVTVEDPIEYLYTDKTCVIEQREVGYDTNSFADALRHVVRQSPDVILIGEMRDLDTMRVALSAAMTGHLVLTTLHTTDALGTVERILNYFPPDQQHFVRVELAQSLVGVLCQRLLPIADGTGRIPATELLTATPLVRKYLQEGNTAAIADLLHSGRVPGVRSLQRSLTELVQAKLVREEIALAHSPNPDELKLHLGGMYSGAGSLRPAPEPSPEAVQERPEGDGGRKPKRERPAEGEPPQGGYTLL